MPITPPAADLVDPARVLALTQGMIRIPSGTFEEGDVANYLAAYMAGLGLEVELQEVPGPSATGRQAIGRLRGRGQGRSLLLCGHLDTWAGRRAAVWAQPDGDGRAWTYFRQEEWTRPAFDGEVEDGWIYGVGALDQKGGIAAMTCAVETIVRAGIPLRGDVILAATAAEGAGGYGARQLMADGLEADLAIVTEFTDLDVVRISTGGIFGRITIEGDAKLFPPRVDPVAKMLALLAALGPLDQPVRHGDWLTFKPHPDLPGYPWLAIREMATSVGSCTVRFDLRTVPGITEETLCADLERLVERLRAQDPELRVALELPAAPFIAWPAAEAADPDGVLASCVSDWHERVTGAAPVVGAGSRLGAVSDRGHLCAGGISEVLEYGPGLGVPWPMVDERCRVEDIVTATRVLTGVIAELCG